MNINNVLTSKGGVGKSLICTILACYFEDRAQRILNLDLDANQPTFSRYRGLDVQRVEVTRNGKVDSGLFDYALETIYGPNVREGLPRTDIDQVIVDSGAGSYLPFVQYMRRENVMENFADLGYCHSLHVVIVGGQAMDDCVLSLNQLATHFGAGSKIVVWLNSYFDNLPWSGINEFYESRVYRKYEQLIHGVVEMPDLDPETEGRAFARFSKANQTFAEALSSGDLSYADSKRLLRLRQTYYEQLDPIFGTHNTRIVAEAE